MEKLKQTIKEIVNEEQGIKEITLVVKIIQTYAESGEENIPNDVQIIKTLDKLVKEHEIVPVNYVLKKFPNKLKTIYFAKGTEIK
jgi:phosphoenolpyruvate carboxylase